MTDYAALSNEELSAEVAKRLFGWRWYRRQMPMTYTYWLDETQPDDDLYTGKARPYDPDDVEDEYHGLLALEPYEGESYASDHNAAMGLVVPEMRKRGWRFNGHCDEFYSVALL